MLKRIDELSKPKARNETDEDTTGPGTFSPNENFLSTKFRSPSVIIGRSERFIRSKIREIHRSAKRLIDIEVASPINYSNSGKANIISSHTKKIGHNHLLGDDSGIQGLRNYSTGLPQLKSSFSFTKAKKNFSWKKGIG